ncbi:MAG: peptidoglycan DD-metalloendopeptidase family protein [Candidatus Harrisonbacteria bacterium]|nr:peptidoglycan DD-metalloendopeptidase family protein [Candidatus Harrisonbacteria bacterium]
MNNKSYRTYRAYKSYGAYLIAFFLLPLFSLAAEIPQNLKNTIQEKTQALQEINQKILQTEKELEETEGKSLTLQKEIKQKERQLSQLNLNIKAGEITIERLNLEIESLKYDVTETRTKISAQKNGIAQILKSIQRRDSENTLTVLLKNSSLAESLAELENLLNLNVGLSAGVNKLSFLDKNLSDQLGLTAKKQTGVISENKNLKNRQLIAGSEKNERQNLLTRTKNQEKLYADQLKELKKLQAEVSAEVEKIEAELRLKIDPALLPIPRPGVLSWPITMKNQGGTGRLTQKWGIPSPLYGGRAHNGIDIGAPIGTPIFAAGKGRVAEVWNQDRYCYKGAYGKFIIIEHENNLTTLYAHLSLQSVKKGDYVNQGDLIGYVGQTGYATGPHLHFTVYASQTFILKSSKVNCGPIMPFGGDLDPLQYL